MTTEQQTATPDPAEEDGLESTTDAERDGDADDTEDGGKPSREAATYRRRLRDTEAERDGLRTTVESLQRAEVERIAATELAQPAAIWKAEGAELAAMLDDDGRVDPGKVSALIADAKAALGLAGPPTGPSLDLGARGSAPTSGSGWDSALEQRRRW